MSYCVRCGALLKAMVPSDDDRERLICPSCGHIAYINPKVVVAALPVVDGRVLLLRRGMEPRRNAWTYPGGFLEMGETAEEGVLRETREELGIQVGGLRLLGVYSRPGAGVVVIVYLAEVLCGEPRPSLEALESAFFGPEEIPWQELAFPSTVSALRDWVSLSHQTSPAGR